VIIWIKKEEGKVIMSIELKVGDITKEKSCAIVNAANSSLLGGGGVDGAIHRAAGELLDKACRDLRRTRYPEGLPTGQAVATPAGNLFSQYVIHTVGPIYNVCKKEQNCNTLLAQAYQNSLRLAQKLGCNSITFPAISTGIYRFPPKEAAKIAWRSAQKFLEEHPDMHITFIFHSTQAKELFEEAIK